MYLCGKGLKGEGKWDGMKIILGYSSNDVGLRRLRYARKCGNVISHARSDLTRLPVKMRMVCQCVARIHDSPFESSDILALRTGDYFENVAENRKFSHPLLFGLEDRGCQMEGGRRNLRFLTKMRP